MFLYVSLHKYMEEHLADEDPNSCKIVHVEGVSQCIVNKK